MSKEELIIGFFEKGYCLDLDEVKNTCLNILKENADLKRALIDIKKYMKKIKNFYWVENDESQYVSEDILEIIDKVLEDKNNG